MAPVSKFAMKAFAMVERCLHWPGDLAALPPLPPRVTEKPAGLSCMFGSQTWVYWGQQSWRAPSAGAASSVDGEGGGLGGGGRDGAEGDLGQRNWKAKRAVQSKRASGSLLRQPWLDWPFQPSLLTCGGYRELQLPFLSTCPAEAHT